MNDDFRSLYREAQDKIVPDERLVGYLRTRMSRGAVVAFPGAKTQHQPDAAYVQEFVARRRFKRVKMLRRLVAVAAAFALIIGACGWVGYLRNSEFRAQQSLRAKASVPGARLSYDEIYQVMYAAANPAQEYGFGYEFKNNVFNNFVKSAPGNDMLLQESYSFGGMTNSTTATDASGRPAYSDTNIQVDGVDEADVVKTDGEYIYVLHNNIVSFMKVTADGTEVVASLELPAANADDVYAVLYDDMYVGNDRMVVVGQSSVPNPRTDGGVTSTVTIYVYDITDRANPVLMQTEKQSGHLQSSRLSDGILYTISRYYVNMNAADQTTPESFVPCVTNGDVEQPVPARDIAISDAVSATGYVLVTALDVAKPQDGFLSQQAALGRADTVYMSNDHLLLASTASTPRSGFENSLNARGAERTNLLSFALNDGRMEQSATGSIPGSLLNQFSLDEHNGHFRAVTQEIVPTSNRTDEWGNVVSDEMYISHLFVMDMSLKIVGKLENLAPEERLYSVRFMGDYGYFVTYHEIIRKDPLFTVDLRDPVNPVIKSELEIPGFSEYLHPFGEGLLLGMGQTGNGNLKLSMFDISNPEKVNEQNKLDLPYSQSPAQQNHKAFLVSVSRNLIAFVVQQYYDDGSNWGGAQPFMVVYAYDKANGFTRLAEIPLIPTTTKIQPPEKPVEPPSYYDYFNDDNQHDAEAQETFTQMWEDYHREMRVYDISSKQYYQQFELSGVYNAPLLIDTRALYIGDTFYIVTPSKILRYALPGLTAIDSMTFAE